MLFIAWGCTEGVLGAQDPTQLLEQASKLSADGRYKEAIPLAEQAVAAYESQPGPAPALAGALMALGQFQFQAGDFAGAGRALERLLRLREQAQPRDDRAIAAAASSLANARRGAGQVVEAEELLRRALALQEHAVGPDTLDVARTLISLGSLLSARGDVAGGEAALLRARGIFTAKQVTETAEFARLLNNLGYLYQQSGALDKAREPLESSLALREKLLPPNHPTVLLGLANLAGLHQERGDLDRAEPMFRRALAAYETTLGPSHPTVAAAVGNLAILLLLQNKLTEAEPLYLRALQINESVLGPRHASVAMSLERLAVFYQVAGRPSDALRAMTRSADIVERNLQVILGSGSEQQRLNYMATVRENTEIALSMRSALLSDSPEAAAAAASLVLRRKGRVLDAMVSLTERLRARATDEDRAQLERLAAARSELATLVLETAPAKNEDRTARIKSLEGGIDGLESALSKRSRETESEIRTVDLASVQAQLADDTVLVEGVKYRAFNPRIAGQGNRFGAARYALVILRRTGTPRWVELGDADAIDRRIAAFRSALRSPASTDVKERSRELARLVLDPIDTELSRARRLLIAPDGELNVIPFAALIDGQGRFLVERADIAYLASGRELLRQTEPRLPPREAPLIVANPSFHLGDAAATPKPPPKPPRTGAFAALPGTAEEATAVQGLLSGARLVTGAHATETVVKRVKGPRVLHLATHGFFFDRSAVGDRTAGPERRGLTIEPMSAEDSTGRFALLRSGLALAGADERQGGGGEDGLLTALEAASLDLRGTQLVALSACETGLGEVRSGDGVYGLRRALAIAGAESQVMSLWQVSDRSTRDLMIAFYQKLAAGEGRAASLRAVQLEWLRSRAHAHPFHWAAFVLAGDWTPMRAP